MLLKQGPSPACSGTAGTAGPDWSRRFLASLVRRLQQRGPRVNLLAAFDWFCERSQDLEYIFNLPG